MSDGPSDARREMEEGGLRFAGAACSAATCERCKGTGIDQTEHCEGRLTGMTCDCPLGKALMEEHYKNHPDDR